MPQETRNPVPAGVLGIGVRTAEIETLNAIKLSYPRAATPG